MNIAIIGYGRMGKRVEDVLVEMGREDEIEIIIDPGKNLPWSKDCLKGIDTAICFTTPDDGYATTTALLEEGVDTIVGTTDFYLDNHSKINQEMIGQFRELCYNNKCHLVYSPNFAIGAKLFMTICALATRELSEYKYDVGVLESHHKIKKDVSGTAKKIANLIIDNYPGKKKINVNEFSRQREEDEVTIGSLRAGNIPGTHTVLFDSMVDSIELTHRVRDPRVFAHGAVVAADLCKDVPKGVYDLDALMSM